MTAPLSTAREHGDSTFVSTSGLRLTARPERGGKITSLRDAQGTEWLTRAATRASAGLPFIEAEMAGWDECAPTIDACVVDGHILPDHGDAWDASWTGDVTNAVHHGSSLPYVLERRVVPATSGGVRLEYRASVHRAAERVPFLWAAHPQFSAPPGTTVSLIGPVTRVVDVLAAGSPELPAGAVPSGIDEIPEGGCRKLYVHPRQTASGAVLTRPDGSRLTMTWSPSCPYVGLWFDNRTYAPEPVIAIEPALAYADSLARAVEAGTAAWLEPSRPLEWWVEISVEATAP